MEEGDLVQAVGSLEAFLGRTPLTAAIAELESHLNGASSEELGAIMTGSGAGLI